MCMIMIDDVPLKWHPFKSTKISLRLTCLKNIESCRMISVWAIQYGGHGQTSSSLPFCGFWNVV